jgi:hypothetical protein
MNNLITREILAAAYERAMKRGDRSGARRIWLRLAAATNAVLAG